MTRLSYEMMNRKEHLLVFKVPFYTTANVLAPRKQKKW